MKFLVCIYLAASACIAEEWLCAPFATRSAAQLRSHQLLTNTWSRAAMEQHLRGEMMTQFMFPVAEDPLTRNAWVILIAPTNSAQLSETNRFSTVERAALQWRSFTNETEIGER